MRRPPSVTAFAVLNVLFGVLGLLYLPHTLFRLLAAGPGPGSPDREIAEGQMLMFGWGVAWSFLGSGMAALLLLGGIGMLRLQRWSRLGALIYSVFAVVSGVIGLVLGAVIFAPVVSEAARKSGDPALSGSLMLQLDGQSCWLLYPVAQWVFLTRPEIRALFQASPPVVEGPPAELPEA